MRQTILSVVLDVEPQSARRLSDLIEEFKKDQEPPGAAEWYSDLKQGVPSLHFMSMSVFESASYDPIFVIEANFDGPPGPFWAQMEAAFGAQLRPMLRCCKRPADGDGLTYDAVTQPLSRYPLAPYLEKRTLQPSVFHQGNRGLERDRILRERELFLATREALAPSSPTLPNPYRGIPAEEIHRKLRGEFCQPGRIARPFGLRFHVDDQCDSSGAEQCRAHGDRRAVDPFQNSDRCRTRQSRTESPPVAAAPN